jgi:hypothetical protein
MNESPTTDYIMSTLMDARLQMFRSSALSVGKEAFNIDTIKTLTDIAEYAIELIAQMEANQASREWSAVWKQAAKTHRKFGQQMAQRVEDAEQGWHDEVTSGYDER